MKELWVFCIYKYEYDYVCRLPTAERFPVILGRQASARSNASRMLRTRRLLITRCGIVGIRRYDVEVSSDFPYPEREIDENAAPAVPVSNLVGKIDCERRGTSYHQPTPSPAIQAMMLSVERVEPSCSVASTPRVTARAVSLRPVPEGRLDPGSRRDDALNRFY